MLNLALSTNPVPKISEILLTEEGFLPSLSKLLEHHSIVIRGKCLLTFLLLFKHDFQWLAIADSEIKFYHYLDRIVRDNFKYVQCCLLCLVDGIVELIPHIFKRISEELTILLNGGKAPIVPSTFDRVLQRSEFKSLQGNLVHIAIILDLHNTQVIRNRIVTVPFIRSIATLIDSCDVYSFPGADEFINALLLIAESLSSNTKVLLAMAEPILTYLMPTLLSKMKSESTDIRFLSLKIFTDIMIQYLHDEGIYDSPVSQLEQAPTTTTKANDLILKQLFPCYELILTDNDPVPVLGLKLLAALLERNPLFVQVVKKLSIFSIVSDFYSISNQRLNRHTIKIVKSLVEQKELTFDELAQHRLLEKTNQILRSMLANKQDWCVEVLLDIIHELLSQFNEVVKTHESEISRHIEEVFKNFGLCVQLLAP